MACTVLLQLLDSQSNVVRGTSIVICVDSQAAIKALAAFHTTSILVKECKELLNQVGGRIQITIMWVPGHSNVPGNDMADLLARQGSSQHISWAVKIPTPPAFFKELVRRKLWEKSSDRWTKSKNVGTNIWDSFSCKQSTLLLGKSRIYIRKVIYFSTGHWTFGRHARRLGILDDLCCPGCGLAAEDTDIEHVWCVCPAFAESVYSISDIIRLEVFLPLSLFH